MKRTLLLAGCLVLCAGCGKKAASQQKKAEITYAGPTDAYALAVFDNVPHLGDYAYASSLSAGDVTDVPASELSHYSDGGCMGKVVEPVKKDAAATGKYYAGVDLSGCSWQDIKQPTNDATKWTSCYDPKTNKPISCDVTWVSGVDKTNWSGALLPMVAPTMHDVVTHTTEKSCRKGYEEWELQGPYAGGWTLTTSEDNEMIPVCVTPAFIADLKKANGEK